MHMLPPPAEDVPRFWMRFSTSRIEFSNSSILSLSFFPRSFWSDVASPNTWSRMLVLMNLRRSAAASAIGGVAPGAIGTKPVKIRLNAALGSVMFGRGVSFDQEIDSRKEQGAPSHPSPAVLTPSCSDESGRLQAEVSAAIR